MGRISKVVAALLLTTVLSVYLTINYLISGSTGPGHLIGYPDAKDIEAVLSRIPPNTNFTPPFSTQGRYVVDSEKERIKLTSVNWYGASDELFVVGGLDVRHRDDIALTLKRLGFNSVRLPYSDQLVRDDPVVDPSLLSANGDLVNRTALEIFAEVVESLTAAGLAVIINNHITSARWCCDANLCDGKWYNSYLGPICPVRQSQEDWIAHLETVMGPHINNPFVVGVDLRNEVRGVTDRLLWGSWASAVEEAAGRLHLMQPDWLMFVEGVSSANVVSGARTRPIQLNSPNKLVYSAHVYGWSGWGSLRPYWKRQYSSFAADMGKNWAFLLKEDIAPVWIGEFGAPDIPNVGDVHYWSNLMRYLRHVDVDIAYWAINPRKPKGNGWESYGLLEDDWETPRWDYRLWDIHRLALTREYEKAELE